MERVLLEILNSMKKSIAENSSKSKIKDNINLPLPKTKNNFEKLTQLVMEFSQEIVDENEDIKGFVIIIDEFQMLDHPDEFFALMKRFNQTQHNVCYIFTASITESSSVINKINGKYSPFGDSFQQITIKPFSKSETKAYFDECMSEIKFSKDGFDCFYEITKGIPLYINSFYNIMDSNEYYTKEAVKKAFIMNFEQILCKCFKIWSNLSDKEKTIVKALVDRDLTLTKLLNKSELAKPTCSKYLSKLINRGILKHTSNKYSLADDMLKKLLKYEKKIYGYYPL